MPSTSTSLRQEYELYSTTWMTPTPSHATHTAADLDRGENHIVAEGPAIEVTFLGIIIDTITQDKLTRLADMLTEWQTRRSCTRKELELLIWLLNNARKLVRPGRPFLRCMIDLLQAVHHPPSSTAPISWVKAIGPFFMDHEGQTATKEWFTQQVRQDLTARA